ncbi:hypothetical protein [Cupriavidus sp. YR651]|uniref:hypothetical protein n=1 Tax=Cupriavidus sp. YR651 TaxID=1855315 RepID=UPI000B83BF21|nr:hypothetical protein [Cupriavidus sp. YR651]
MRDASASICTDNVANSSSASPSVAGLLNNILLIAMQAGMQIAAIARLINRTLLAQFLHCRFGQCFACRSLTAQQMPRGPCTTIT